jgi:hypothetical protein
MGKVLGALAKALRAVLRFLVAFWLAAFYRLVGDIEGFEGRRE